MDNYGKLRAVAILLAIAGCAKPGGYLMTTHISGEYRIPVDIGVYPLVSAERAPRNNTRIIFNVEKIKSIFLRRPKPSSRLRP